MRLVILDELAELSRKHNALLEANCFLGIDSQGNILLRSEDFIKTFDTYDMNYRGEEYSFPYRLSANYNGATFEALFNEKELERYGIQIQEQNLQMDV